jgi:putative peptide zinc metalloprotease protein
MTEAVLPPMREDLSLLPGPLVEGAPSWSIYDPARHRFLRLGWLDFEILSRWRLRTMPAIVDSISHETTLRPSEDDVKRFALFAQAAGLLQAAMPGDTARFVREQRARRHSWLMWLIHNYLFVRLRLIDPDRLLSALLPLVRGLYSRGGLIFVAGLGLCALYLISRQWESYTHSLVEQTTFEGLLQMGVALSIAKVFHELGHGFAAKRFGCRVPSMGIAFLVLWPVLWTDTTDAWRLVDRRQRLLIDVSGMATEIAIAAVASIAWAVLPDGPTRSAMFVLSSSTWILTLFVNLSPLMRFDGYYIMSDLLDFPNLQERGFAYTRWFMRELMFRPHAAPPERLSPTMARVVVLYSMISWIYRFFLFTGIAVLVYHLTFKVLGIILMAIEIWYFVARPIVREIMAWAKLPTLRRPNRHTFATFAVLGLVLAALCVPWRGRVDAPALLRSERQVVLLSAEPGRLVYGLPRDAHVADGEVIYRLESIEVQHDVASARARLEQAQGQQTAGSFNPERRREQQTNVARVAEAAAALADAELRQANLEIRAPFKGELRDVPEGLRPGDDIRRLERLGVLVSGRSSVIEAYVAESDLERVRPGAAARFLPVDGPALSLVVAEVARTSTRTLDVPELGSVNEGPIPVRRAPASSTVLVPDVAIYRVTLVGTESLPPVNSRVMGEVVIDAPPRSAIAALYNRAVAVVLREAMP